MAIINYPPTSSGGGVSSVSGTAPIASSGGATPAISIPKATSLADGYLSSTDWSTFNGKQAAGSYLTTVTVDAPLTGSGTSGSHLSIPAASSSTNGYLSSANWTTFNNKAASGANTDITSVALTTGTISTAPSGSTDIANKSYVDGLVSAGLTIHQAVRVESDGPLTVTYNNGTAGVGATMTNAGVQAALVLDGVTLAVNDRVMIYEQADPTQNGIYTVTNIGSPSTNWVMTRATDADTYGAANPNKLGQGSYFLIQEGLHATGEAYVCNNVGTITFGTTAISFQIFSQAPIYTGTAPINVTGQTIALTGTVGIANGGTGASTAATALTSLGAYPATNPSGYTSNTGTVTSVAALTLGTTGTDLSSTVATGTSTPVITLNVPTASATNRGALSSADWSTFNGKQNTLVSATNIKTINSSSILGSGNLVVTGALAKSTSAFTTGTGATYTAPANTQWVKVTVVGPGGNGGGAASQRATGGGGGAVAIKWLAMNASQTLTYTVGTASGTASTVSSGTLVITTISAGSGTNGAGTAYAASQTAGGAGGTATGGDINITGGQGGYSYGSSTTVTTNFSGKGGDCPGFGSGGPALAMVATAGVQGQGYGAGGGGAHGSATTAAGRGGIIIFEAY